jgi:hypothetical protein
MPRSPSSKKDQIWAARIAPYERSNAPDRAVLPVYQRVADVLPPVETSTCC